REDRGHPRGRRAAAGRGARGDGGGRARRAGGGSHPGAVRRARGDPRRGRRRRGGGGCRGGGSRRAGGRRGGVRRGGPRARVAVRRRRRSRGRVGHNSVHSAVAAVWICRRSSRTERLLRPQVRRPARLRSCLFRLQMAKNDLFTTDIPTPRNPARRVVESRRMTLAPVPIPAAVPGDVPPQNLEAEESVLGAMMISPGAIAAVSEILDAGDFYRESHARIYRAALQLYGKNEPVDAITLTNELEQRGELEEIGGRVRLHELARLVPATANARHYAEIVRENATLRGLIRAGGEIAQLGWERE